MVPQKALPAIAALTAVLTFVGVLVTSAATAKVIAIVGIIITGGCLSGWGIIERSKGA